jgi:hypothetical protein
MRPVETMHPACARALRRLARRDIGVAEAHRRLIPVAAKLGIARPTYWRVRLYLEDARIAHRHRAEIRDAVLDQLALGRFPRPEDLAP